MKMLVAGVQRIVGVAKASQQPFDMCELMALVPVETVQGKVSINGAGYKVMNVPLAPECLPLFLSLKFPCQIELLSEARPYRGKLETMIVGLVPALPKAA